MHIGEGWALSPGTGFLLRERRGRSEMQADTQREEGYVKVEQRLHRHVYTPKNPKARREVWNDCSLRASQRNQSCQYPEVGLLASRTVKE